MHFAHSRVEVHIHRSIDIGGRCFAFFCFGSRYSICSVVAVGGNLSDDMSGGCELTSQQGSSVGDNGALAIADADAGLLGLAIDGGLKC